MALLLAFGCELGRDSAGDEAMDLGTEEEEIPFPTGGAARANAPADPMIARVCAASACSDRFATVRVHLDANDRPAAYEHRGDPGNCSHPPTFLYDRDAQVLVVLAEHESPEETAQHRADFERALEGLHLGPTYPCPGDG
ncbi:MAG: hypothetical protein AB7S26_10550 [Sandaracinaceae bacterium]